MLIAQILLQAALCAGPQVTWQSYTDFNDISGLCADTSGMVIYGATSGGLFAFSAGDTALIRHLTNVDGLPHIDVTAAAAGPDDRVWIGTRGGGICAVDLRTGIAGPAINRNEGLISDTVLAVLYFHAAGPGDRVIAGMPGGLSLIDPADGAIVRTYYPRQGYPLGDAVQALAVRHDSLWIGTNLGVAVVPFANMGDTANWTRYASLGGISTNVISLFADDTMIVAGTTNGTTRKGAGPGWQSFAEIGAAVRSIATVGDSVFFATSNGVKFFHAGSTANLNTGLPSMNVKSLARDRQNCLWAGTSDGLALRSLSGWRPFRFDCISGNQCGRVAVSVNGTVWAGVTGALVDKLQDGRWKSFPNPIPTIPMRSLTTDLSDNLWCGLSWWTSSGNSYIMKIDPNDSLTVFTTPDVPQRAGIWAAFCDEANVKYFSAYNFAIVRVSADESSWTTFADPSPAGSYPEAMWIQSIARDRDGALWLGSYYNSLARVDEAAGTWAHFGKASGIPDINIRSIAVAEDNALWLATALGLARARYDAATGKLSVTAFTAANSPILGDDVRAARIDRSGNVWAATSRGLSLRTWDGHWTNFTRSDIDRTGSRLLSDDVKDIAVGQRDGDGDDIWVATSLGLNRLRCRRAPAIEASGSSVAPNPFRPGTNPCLMFSQLPAGATVRIYTIDGRLVGAFPGHPAPAHQLVLRTGTDLSSLGSGLYLCHISAPGAQTRVLKLAVMR